MNTTLLDALAEVIANEAIQAYTDAGETEEPMDGDETEYLAKRFLEHLDEMSGNVSK